MTGVVNTQRGAAGSHPWVIVAGGFHQHGGLDKANAALASYLLERGDAVQLVGHQVDSRFDDVPNATVHVVERPSDSVFLGGFRLRQIGQAVAARVCASDPIARGVVNGGNCPWPGINWVHYVHGAWSVADRGAPAWFRTRQRLVAALARKKMSS